MTIEKEKRINKNYYHKRNKILNHLSYHVEESENV